MGDFLRSRAHSFAYAFAGIGYLLKTQKNAWIHAVITVLVFTLGIWLAIPIQNWAILITLIGLVWAAECFNTAIETITDLFTSQPHPLAKIAKDVAAAGVLIAAICAGLVGILILGIPLFQKIFLSN